MKKYFAIMVFAVAMSAMVACDKDSRQDITPDTPGSVIPSSPVEITFSASLEDATKVTLSADGKVRWEEGDAISIFDGVSNVRAEASNISGDGKTADFTATVAAADTYYAVYPYSEASTIADAVIGNSTVTAPEQDGSFAMAHACAACIDPQNPSFVFKNIVSLIAFSTARTDISCVEIVGANGEALCGAGTIAFAADGQPAFTQASAGSNAVVNIAKTAGSYYVGVTPVALENGFTINFYDGTVDNANLIGVINSSKSLNVAPGKVVSLGNLDDHYDLSGAGTESDPWLIRSGYDMNLMREKKVQQELHTTEYYKLTRDIDLSAYENWVPVDTRNEDYRIYFDGQNHTVRNMTLVQSGDNLYGGLFGLIVGTVKNLRMDILSISATNSSHVAALGGWVGNSSHNLGEQLIENVVVTNAEISSTGGGNVAGIVGCSGWADIKNCSFRGTLTANTGFCGGIVAKSTFDTTYPVTTPCEISGCSVDATITSKGRYVGGITGQVYGSGNILNCSVKGRLETTVDLVGGIVAWASTGVVESCKVEADIKAVKNASSAYSYVGGIVGYNTSSQPEMTIRKCSYKGTITTSGNTNGGIMGNASSPVLIEQCSSEGRISVTGSYVGGIFGYSPKAATDKPTKLTILNCWSSMDVIETASSNSYAAGIAADLPSNSTITNCYSTGNVKGGFCLAGIAARLSNITNIGSNLAQNFSNSVVGCIAANPSIQTTMSSGDAPSSHYSSGAVVGFTATKNTMANCYRNPEMNFHVFADSKYDVLYDQDNCNSTTPLTRAYTDATADKYLACYHGKAYSSGQTISEIASALGWDTTVWDLSGDLPKLK